MYDLLIRVSVSETDPTRLPYRSKTVLLFLLSYVLKKGTLSSYYYYDDTPIQEVKEVRERNFCSELCIFRKRWIFEAPNNWSPPPVPPYSPYSFVCASSQLELQVCPLDSVYVSLTVWRKRYVSNEFLSSSCYEESVCVKNECVWVCEFLCEFVSVWLNMDY